MMAKLESRQEFAAFERQLKQSGDAAVLTREQMKRLNDAAKNGAGEAKTAYDRLAASIKTAASAADLQRAAAQAKEAFKNGIITAAQTRRPALPPPSRPRRRKSASRCPTCNA